MVSVWVFVQDGTAASTVFARIVDGRAACFTASVASQHGHIRAAIAACEKGQNTGQVCESVFICAVQHNRLLPCVVRMPWTIPLKAAGGNSAEDAGQPVTTSIDVPNEMALQANFRFGDELLLDVTTASGSPMNRT